MTVESWLRGGCMSDLDKYKNVFVEAFGVSIDDVEGLKYDEIEEWDSVGHMRMIALLEEAFIIEPEIDDVFNYQSFENGKNILKSYGIVDL